MCECKPRDATCAKCGGCSCNVNGGRGGGGLLLVYNVDNYLLDRGITVRKSRRASYELFSNLIRFKIRCLYNPVYARCFFHLYRQYMYTCVVNIAVRNIAITLFIFLALRYNVVKIEKV